MNNTAAEGAAIHFSNTMFNGTISNCTFVNNFINKSSSYSMGVVYLAGHNNHISDCIFINNTDSTANGGLRCISIYATYTYSNFISNCTFVDNKCGAIASAVVNTVKSYNNSILGCTFINNSAASGGAIFLNSDNDIIANCNFVNNTSIHDRGHAIGWSGDNLSVINCTFKIKAGKILFNASDDYSSLIFTLKANINYKSTIYNAKNKRPDYYNLTYWYDIPVDNSNFDTNSVIVGAGQNITLEVYDSKKQLVDNVTRPTDSNGQIKYDYTWLPYGKYTYKLYHLDNDEFLKFNRAGSFQHLKAFELSADNLTMSYRDGSTWSATLTDGSSPISNVDVKFHISDQVFTRKTNSKGVARLTINLDSGTYDVLATVGGDGTYALATAKATITVNKVDAFLSGEDIVMSYNDGSCMPVKVVDLNNNPISGALVYVNNTLGVYKYRTDSEGIANVPIRLKVGQYDYIISCDETNYNYVAITKSVTVNKAKTNIAVENVTMGYRDGTKYVVTLTDAKGNPVSNVTVSVKNDDIVTYRYHTDENGIVNAPIKWAPGEYEFTASFDENSLYEAASNKSSNVVIDKATVKLSASNTFFMYYKSKNMTARLTYGDGSPVSGVTIKVTQDGNVRRYHTDSDGVVTVPINLQPGEYKYALRYEGNSLIKAVGKTVIVYVEKIPTYLAADSILMTFQDGTNYTAKLTDYAGKPLAGFIVKVNNTVVVYKYKTDDEGIISFPINMRVGHYKFTAFIDGNQFYNPTSKTTRITITR